MHAFYLLILFFFSFHFLDAKTIGIFTYKVFGSDPWDPESVKSGITGSEEAVICISKHLADLGYQVFIYGNPPKQSLHTHPNANPRYLDIDKDDGSFIDIAISWRQPYIGEALKKRAHQVYLWPHDTYHQPLSKRQISAFDDVLWLSEWQRLYWISVNPGFAKFTRIFGNGINEEDFRPIKKRENPFSCIYGSNYARGLEVLLNIWPTVKASFPKATLDIYYGWQHWGLLSPEKEMKMRKQIAKYHSLGVREHGCVGHEELHRAYENASIWTYPCIGWEVFCITALKAQYAGAIPVIIDGTALPETVHYGYFCTKQEEYLSTLIRAMQEIESKGSLENRKAMRYFIQQSYTWKKVAMKWQSVFETQVAP